MDTWSAAITLFLIMDPLGNLPVFMSVLKTIEPKRRRIVLARELLFSLIIMFTFLFSGQVVLDFLNVRQESVSIAGGIILFLIGLKMIFPQPGGVTGLASDEEPFIVPLAIPIMLSSKLHRLLGERGLIAIERLMGMILIMISIQMLLDGIGNYYSLG